MSAKKAVQSGLTLRARVASDGTVALAQSIMGKGPVPASQLALQRAGWKLQDADPLASNEAVAAQACSVNAEKGGDTSKVNIDGSAMVIGHLIGASGCPEAVGGLIFDLVFEEAAFVTGANIAINGGQHMQ